MLNVCIKFSHEREVVQIDKSGPRGTDKHNEARQMMLNSDTRNKPVDLYLTLMNDI